MERHRLAMIACCCLAVLISQPLQPLSIAAEPLVPAESPEEVDLLQADNKLLSGQDDYRREVVAMNAAYTRWGMTRQSRSYATIAAGAEGEDRAHSIDWSKQAPMELRDHEFLCSLERFRAECFAPAALRTVLTYDGVVTRYRDQQRVLNGPVDRMRSPFENVFAPQLPHGAFINYDFLPDVQWMYGARQPRPQFLQASVSGKVEFSEQEFNGHPCWKINWRARHSETMDTVIYCEVYLARDRYLMPLRQTFRETINGGMSLVTMVETDELQLDPSTQLWYPKHVTVSRRRDATLEVDKVRYAVSHRYNKDSVFAEAPAFNTSHDQPPKPRLSAYAQLPVLQKVRTRGFSTMRLAGGGGQKSAGSGIVGLLLFCAAISFALKSTPRGRRLRAFVARNRGSIGATGIVLTAAVGFISHYLDGWSTYGLSMIAAGLFGLCWIGVSMAVIGDKQLSIRVMLFAAASIAIMLGGYHKGVKRMQMRQAMIGEVREAGGQVVMGRWRLDEDGLFLPGPMRTLLGEAWTGRANQVAVTQDLFTPANVEGWCLDEVQWIAVGSSEGETFDVDPQALAKIKDSVSLWTLHFEGGYLNADAFEEVSRFTRLVDLYCDCRYRPLPKEIGRLAELERVWLTHPIVDDELLQSLKGVKNLEYVTLIAPRFGKGVDPNTVLDVADVEVRFADLTPAALESLGRIPTQLLLVDCKVKLPKDAKFTMAATQTLSFLNSNLDDATLPRLCDAPNLSWAAVQGTNVSVKGVEAFSKLRPGVVLSLE